MEVSVSNEWAGVSKRLTSRAARPLGWADVVDDNGSKRSELWMSGSRGFRCVWGVSNEFFRMEVSVSNGWVGVSKRLTSCVGVL
ncbi:hypothetical protein Csa_022930 [Cucumis sativus]|nr:hypothetical protein Csa_022930 [Cucumis sativus]